MDIILYDVVVVCVNACWVGPSIYTLLLVLHYTTEMVLCVCVCVCVCVFVHVCVFASKHASFGVSMCI